jgi:hypothetical protein
MQTEYPTIRATVDALKSIITGPFHICWWYSGSDDSGWFNGFQVCDHDDVVISKEAVTDLIAGNLDKIERELYTILERRFPGWEIGDGQVRGSHGWFTIHSATNTITHNHYIDYNEEDDLSPDEEIKF